MRGYSHAGPVGYVCQPARMLRGCLGMLGVSHFETSSRLLVDVGSCMQDSLLGTGFGSEFL